MTLFWIICALLLVVALAFIVLPLLRGAAKSHDVVRDAANLEIYRDQIAEMDADLANGLLTEESYEQGKRELETRLLEEVKSTEGGEQKRNPLKVLALVLVLLVPLASITLYLELGNLNAFLPEDKGVSAEGFGTVLSADGIKKLQDKLQKQPNDPNEWLLLARSLTQLQRYPEAVRAYATLTQMVPNEAQLWADYADALAMTQGQSLVGRPTQLLDRALALDPNNAKALALGGSAAMERGDYATAIRNWQALLKQIPNKSSQEAQMVAAGISQARTFLAQRGGKMPPMMGQGAAGEQGKPALAPGKERITGTVVLSSALKDKASPDDTLFVLAKAEQGPPMPLAVVRKQVRDLPLKFSLDDSNAVMAQMKLSNFDKVVVIARISKSGTPMPQPGDLQGMSVPLKPGKHGLKIDIDQEIK